MKTAIKITGVMLGVLALIAACTNPVPPEETTTTTEATTTTTEVVTTTTTTTTTTPGGADGGPDLIVAVGGGGDCINSPCGSIDAAVARAKSGDVIELAAGSYGPQTIRSGATAGFAENVVVRPSSGADVVVTPLKSYVPNLTFQDFSVRDHIFFYPGAHHNVAQRLDLLEAPAFVMGADDTVWRNNTITPRDGLDGVQIKGTNKGDPAERTLFEGNTIGPGYAVPNGNGTITHTDCIQIFGAHDTVIRNNRILECSNVGIMISGGAGIDETVNVSIEGNEIDECRPQRDECRGFHTILMGNSIPGVRVLHNKLNGSMDISGQSTVAPGYPRPVIQYNTADWLPCVPGTDYNVVQAKPCGPHDVIG